MAEKTIPELNSSSILEDNYAFPMDSGIQTYKVLWSTIKQYVWNNVIGFFTELTDAGNDDLLGVELGTGESAGSIRKMKLSTLKNYITEGGAGVPIGGVLGFFDFNGLLSFDTDVFTLIDGKTISDTESPLNGLTLPNATGRALIGYGTDGSSDQASASWSVSPVGNAGHTVNFSHSHALSSNGFAKLSAQSSGDSATTQTAFALILNGLSSYSVNKRLYAYDGFDVTDQVVFRNQSATATRGIGLGGTTDSAGSSAVNIRMRSIRVRWILRYK